MAEPSSPPPPLLMHELIEEILLRLPAKEPASLVRAALVCKPWHHLVSCPRFQRRFREFHRTPPMLGFLCDHRGNGYSFVPTATSSPLHATTSPLRPLDARHGSVLLRERTRNVLVVWDPITDYRQELPVLPRRAGSCTAAVLCGAGDGACDHHDCHLGGSFLVVFVGTDPSNMFVCTYDSAEYFGAWSEPISLQHPNDCYYYTSGHSPAVLLRNKLFFGIPRTNTALQYDLELREISWIHFPTLYYCYQRSVLTTTEDGLGLVGLSGGELWIWSRMDTPEANAGWTQFKTIDLGRQLHVYASLVGFADGLSIVFVTINGVLYTVDLKTYVVKKVYDGRAIRAVFPYMGFYSPDSQQLVNFLHQDDKENPPQWRIKPFTQEFSNIAGTMEAKLFKIKRNRNITAHSLARQAHVENSMHPEFSCTSIAGRLFR